VIEYLRVFGHAGFFVLIGVLKFVADIRWLFCPETPWVFLL